MNISPVIIALPRTLQIVTKHTHNDKTLDIILTNLHQFYAVPVVLPPMKPDNPIKHKSSDHKYALAVPLNISTNKNTREYTMKTVRSTSESARQTFGAWMLSENWKLVEDATNPTDKVNELRRILNEKVDEHFPVKMYKISSQDFPYITNEIKKLVVGPLNTKS